MMAPFPCHVNIPCPCVQERKAGEQGAEEGQTGGEIEKRRHRRATFLVPSLQKAAMEKRKWTPCGPQGADGSRIRLISVQYKAETSNSPSAPKMKQVAMGSSSFQSGGRGDGDLWQRTST